MATFFGEVLAPVSRAFWDGAEDIDDDDYEMEEPRGPVFKFKDDIKPQVESRYAVMIFATDQFCTDYAHLFLIDNESKIIGTIEKEEENQSEDRVRKAKPSVATLYKLKNDVLLLTCTAKIPLEYANDLLLMITPWLDKSKEAAVLASKPIKEFITLDKLQENAFVRILKTSAYKEDISCKRLEVPNALSGFPAAMMTWRQIQEEPCVLSVFFYTNALPLVNTIDIVPLREHLQSFKWYKQIENPKADSKSVPLYNHVLENSNMYL